MSMGEMEKFNEHIKTYFGSEYGVLHTRIDIRFPMGFHLDYYTIPPNEKHNFWILMSHGMSTQVMNVSLKERQRCELMVFLDPDIWNLNMGDAITGNPTIKDYPVATKNFLEDPARRWPLIAIRELAKYPFMTRTWIGPEHTMDMEGLMPEYIGWLIKTPEMLDPEAITLKLDSSTVVQFYVLVPIFRGELKLAQKKGTDKLLQKFKEKGVNEITKLRRSKVV